MVLGRHHHVVRRRLGVLARPVVQQLADLAGHARSARHRQGAALAEVVLHVDDDQRARHGLTLASGRHCLSGWAHAHRESRSRPPSEQYVDAVGRQDLEATVALFAEDARQEDPVGTPANVGRARSASFFEKAFRGPFTTTLTGPLLVTGDHAAVHFTDRGAHRRPLRWWCEWWT